MPTRSSPSARVPLARKVHALRHASPEPLTLAAIGLQLGESPRRLETVLQASHDLQTLSPDQALGNTEGGASLKDLIGDPSEPGLQEDYQWLHRAFTQLSPLERRVLRLRHSGAESLSLAKIGKGSACPSTRCSIWSARRC